jgi:hypothetical protein
MKTEPTQNEAVEVRYLRAKYKGSTPAELMRNGKIRFADGSIIFEGKKYYPLWLQIVFVFGIANLLAHYFGAVIGALGFFIAGLIAYFARLKALVDVRHDSVKAVIEDRSKQSFLLLTDTGNKTPNSIAWQTTSDTAALSAEFRKLFPSLISNEDIKVGLIWRNMKK